MPQRSRDGGDDKRQNSLCLFVKTALLLCGMHPSDGGRGCLGEGGHDPFLSFHLLFGDIASGSDVGNEVTWFLLED